MAKNAQVHLRIEFEKLAWFKAYCQRNGFTMSDAVRNWIDQLKRKEAQTQRQSQQEAKND
jgi:antitoxin component of RelBE/YafQ-DinJ toxin-antitoxin module